MEWAAIAVAIVIVVLVAVTVVIDYTTVRRSAPLAPTSSSSSQSSLRVRVINMHMLPFHNTTAQVDAAVRAGLFAAGTDVVIMTELFRRPWFLKDPAHALASQMPVAVHVPETRLTLGTFTDSGLAIAARPGLRVSTVAFAEFPTQWARHADRLAGKGVAVFEVAGYGRIAATHLQASDTMAQVPADDAIRARQFSMAVAFAMQHGACALVGDLNTHTTHSAAALAALLPPGAYFVQAPRPTGPAVPSSGDGWRANPAHGAQIDHIIVLNPHALDVDGADVVVDDAAHTSAWTDHASISVTMRFRH
jgi:hypothetical protein